MDKERDPRNANTVHVPRFEKQVISHAGIPQRITFADTPDRCPVCHTSINPRIPDGPPIMAPSGRGSIAYIVFICTVGTCSRPFFAVYEEGGLGFARPTWSIRGLIPKSPTPVYRNQDIESISPDFYTLVQQAADAEMYGLLLIAGAGYRKALEYLVKDYAVRDLRSAQEQALEDGTNDAATIKHDIDAVLSRPLGQIIADIPDHNLREVAKRAAWLGNDETHYTRKWSDEDLSSLKDVLSLVTSYIINEVKTAALLRRMPDPG